MRRMLQVKYSPYDTKFQSLASPSHFDIATFRASCASLPSRRKSSSLGCRSLSHHALLHESHICSPSQLGFLETMVKGRTANRLVLVLCLRP